VVSKTSTSIVSSGARSHPRSRRTPPANQWKAAI
jgi:hypothetical protein